MIFAYYCLKDNTERNIYLQIAHGISQMKNSIEIENYDKNSFQNAVRAVLTDNPHFYWFEGKMSVKSFRKRAIVSPHYIYNYSEIATAEGAISYILSDLMKYKYDNEYKKARILYDWILDNASYSAAFSGQNLYNVFVNKEAVCKGLSKAYQFLLMKLGMFSTIVFGKIGGQSRHIWNVVELEGNYYNVDVSLGYKVFDYLYTGADINNRYRAFLKSDEQFSQTHEILASKYAFLGCAYDYERD